MDYQAYINSQEWMDRRREHFRADPGNARCFVCNWHGKNALHVHHNTYERMGHEASTDLVSLCRDCHSFVHHLEKNCGVSLGDAHKVAKERKGAGEAVPVVSERRHIPPRKVYHARKGGGGGGDNQEWRVGKLRSGCVNLRNHISCIRKSLSPQQVALADAAYLALDKLHKSL